VGATLDFAGSFLLVDVEGGKSRGSREVSLDSAPPQILARRLQEWGVGTVICGAVSRCLWQDLQAQRIRVVPFVSGHTGDVLQAFMNGALENGEFLMAGCPPGARRAWRCRRRRGNGRRV
jgi:predicted Fe-Mo cluster-binding NifX family protein